MSQQDEQWDDVTEVTQPMDFNFAKSKDGELILERVVYGNGDFSFLLRREPFGENHGPEVMISARQTQWFVSVLNAMYDEATARKADYTFPVRIAKHGVVEPTDAHAFSLSTAPARQGKGV